MINSPHFSGFNVVEKSKPRIVNFEENLPKFDRKKFGSQDKKYQRIHLFS